MIKTCDELALVVGKDMTICSFANSYTDIKAQQETLDDIENIIDNGKDVMVDKCKML